MALPAPLSIAQFMSNFLQSYAPVVGVSDISSIPDTDPIVAIAGSNAGASVYLQSQTFALVAFSRAATAQGPDLDSWLADFRTTGSNGQTIGYPGRPQGAAANVILSVTVAIPAGQSSVLIPVDFIVQTQPITVQPATSPQVFQVQASMETVVTANGTYQIEFTAVAPIQVGDVSGYQIFNNIPPNSFTQQLEPLNGITAITNAAAPVDGTNTASDAQARADFVDWITSLSEGTYAAIIAAVQDVAGGLIPGQTFAIYDFASNPTVAPGLIEGVVIRSGTGQYTGSPDDPVMDNIVQAITAVEAFGVSSVLYYAKNYPVTVFEATFTYSQSQLSAAGLTLPTLQGMMTAILQALITSSGSSLGQILYFSTLVQQWRNISVTLPGGVISNIVADVNASDFSATTTGGGTFTVDKIQPGTTGTLDQTGYLSMSLSVVPTYTAIAVP